MIGELEHIGNMIACTVLIPYGIRMPSYVEITGTIQAEAAFIISQLDLTAVQVLVVQAEPLAYYRGIDPEDQTTRVTAQRREADYWGQSYHELADSALRSRIHAWYALESETLTKIEQIKGVDCLP